MAHPSLFSATIPRGNLTASNVKCLEKHLTRHTFHTRSIACIVLMSARGRDGGPLTQRKRFPRPEEEKLGEMHAVLQIQVGSRRQTRTPKSQTTIIPKDDAEQEKLHTTPFGRGSLPGLVLSSSFLSNQSRPRPDTAVRPPPTDMKKSCAPTPYHPVVLFILCFAQTQCCIP